MARDSDSDFQDTTLSTSDVERLWAGVRQRTGVGKSRRGPAWMWPAAIAAGVIIAMGWWAHPVSHDRSYATAAGQHMAVTLSDGTQIALAPSSHLVVPAGYGRATRSVALIGAGHFVVVHNAVHPFSVRVRDAMVRDVGTVFDVRAYADDPQPVVAVTEGSVDLSAGAACPTCATTLSAGDVASVSPQGIGLTHHANLGVFAEWMQHGPLVFDSTPLSDVLQTVERVYNVAVAVRDSTLLRRTITASFDKEPVDDIVASIAEAVGAHVQRTGHKLLLTTKIVRPPHLPDQRTVDATRGLPGT